MINVDCNYKLADDIQFVIDSEGVNAFELADEINVSRTTLDEILRGKVPDIDVCEKFYSYFYKKKLRINAVKEELLKESYETVLFHGSKDGLSEISVCGAREKCDFGTGFYLGENYKQALSFVCDKEKSSVYSFRFEEKDLNVKNFSCDFEWMMAICYFRGKLDAYAKNENIRKIVEAVETSDMVIAPIADNKMYYVMTQFTDGEISVDVALHSLAASNLGLQYVLKTEKALSHLTPIERYYLSKPERDDSRKYLTERSLEVDTKLKMAKREFKNGLYIEEIFK